MTAKILKRAWNFWIDFTEFRAIRKCCLDEIVYGNSIKERKWWGWKHISYPEFHRKATAEIKGKEGK